MLTHLFKLIWNKKKQNFLLMTEMFFSFIVMFAVFTLIVYEYQNYKKPSGFEPDNVWAININYPEDIHGVDTMNQYQQTLKQLIKGMPQVQDASFVTNNIPFSNNSSNTGLEYKKKTTFANVYTTDDSYLNVLKVKMKEGRWFTEADNVGKDKPVVINESLKEKLFENESAVGKVLGSDADRMKVIGVVQDLKDKGDYQPAEAGLYRRMDTSSVFWVSTILVLVKPGADAAFEARLYKAVANYLKNQNLEIEHLAEKRVAKNSQTLVPMIVLLIVAGFLIINVALGLFGVLWYNINKRKGEIGLRRAVGASGNSISWQLVGEALVLSTISLIVGSFFAVQFPLLNVFDLPASTYVIAIIFSVAFIYTLVTLCALYPGKQAAAIYPAVALHED